MKNRPIGIFDSGIGGLSIWRQIVETLPQESTIYIADTKNCPYGNKSYEEISQHAEEMVSFLEKKKSKLVIIACNTVTVSSIDRLRKQFPKIPIIGIVPVIKTAAIVSKNKKIGVLSTLATARSNYQKDLIDKFANGTEVANIGTDKLVPFIENGKINTKEFDQVLKKELENFNEIDTLVLGCSHFPFIERQIQKIIGKDIKILDSSGAVTRNVKRVLKNNKIASKNNVPGHKFYTTGEKKAFERISSQLLGKIALENVSFYNIDKLWITKGKKLLF